MAKRNKADQVGAGIGCLVLGVAALAMIGSCQQRGEIATAPTSPSRAVQPAVWDLNAPKPPDGWSKEKRRAWWVAKNKRAKAERQRLANEQRQRTATEKALEEDQRWRDSRKAQPLTAAPTPLTSEQFEAMPAPANSDYPAPVAGPPPAFVPSSPIRSGRGGRCNPNGICTACSNCSECKHCAERGGKCSVCS